MAIFKATMLIQLATNTPNPTNPARRIGGWSESWYDLASNQSAVVSDFRTLCNRRAAILSNGGTIVGQRYQSVDPVGPATTDNFTIAGSAGNCDQPQAALLCRCRGVIERNIRPMILRGIPDAVIVDGEFQGSHAFNTALQAYFRELVGWRFRGRDLTQPATPIITVAADGTGKTESAHGLVAGDMVRILRSHTAGGVLVSGRFSVLTAPTSTTFTLFGWSAGIVFGGKIRKDAVTYPQVATRGVELSRVITRRVGRPFTQYRGRRSATH